MGEPIRVLQGFITPMGGVTKYTTNNYMSIDKEKVQFDFVTAGETKLEYENSLTEKGGKVFYCCKITHPFRYYRRIKQIIKDNGYKTVHFNISYATAIPFMAAKAGGAETLIAHAHSSGFENSNPLIRLFCWICHILSKPFMMSLATSYFACSDLAAAWVFGEKVFSDEGYKFMSNAIDCKKYVFNQSIRTKMRNQFMSNSSLIIGHVGNFNYPKNHELLIKVFLEAKKIESNCELWLVGEGDLKSKVEAQIKALGLNDSIKLFGKRSDVNELMQAMDVFVLTSRFEGFPIVGVEAQASGLPCIFADTITRQANITDLVEYISAEASCKEWGEKIVAAAKNTKRCNTIEMLSTAGFDQGSQVQELTDFYSNLF